ncbi:unnamed protein product [Trichogramma brassicae]|uniref:Uncharacterized protein n=1 Tax=Trichogramma brassicae TaxID=86971 RepID=A0A6H5IZQ5_9HYME|nr:unnamed protein product [Trichogramma brassicae]
MNGIFVISALLITSSFSLKLSTACCSRRNSIPRIPSKLIEKLSSTMLTEHFAPPRVMFVVLPCVATMPSLMPYKVTPSLADRRRFSASLGSAPLLSRDSSGGPHYRRRCRRRAPAAPRYISRRTGPLRHSLVSSCAEHISRTSGEVRHSRSPRVTKTQRRVLSRITGDCTYLSDFQRSRNSIPSSWKLDKNLARSNPKLDSERGAVRRVASVGVLPSGSTLRRPVIQVHRPLRRAVVLSDSPPVRCIKKPPPPSRSSPSTTPTDPPSAQLPTKRPVIQVPRPLRRAVVLSDSPPVRRAEKPKPLPPPVTVPAPEELPCIRQLTRPVLVTPEQRPPACKTPGKRQPLPPRPAGRELDTLPESFRGLAIRTPKLRLNDDVPASDPSDGTRDLLDRLNELRLASPPPSRPRSIRRRRDGKYKTRSTLRRDRARLRFRVESTWILQGKCIDSMWNLRGSFFRVQSAIDEALDEDPIVMRSLRFRHNCARDRRIDSTAAASAPGAQQPQHSSSSAAQQHQHSSISTAAAQQRRHSSSRATTAQPLASIEVSSAEYKLLRAPLHVEHADFRSLIQGASSND